MIESKKGMSQVVTIVIMVVLVLIAAGIIWAVISNLIGQGTGQIELNQKCINIDIKPSLVTCNASEFCNVTVTRSATGEDIAGIKIKFITTNGENSEVITQEGNILKLETKTFSFIDVSTLDTTENVDIGEVTISPYFITETGEEHICSQAPSYNL